MSAWDVEVGKSEGDKATGKVRLVGGPSTPVTLAHLRAALQALGIETELVPPPWAGRDAPTG
jgi:hypothetical protein